MNGPTAHFERFKTSRSLASVAAAFALAVSGCSAGGRPDGAALYVDAGNGGGTISGQVVDAPVSGGAISIYRLDGTSRGAAVGTATTDGTGAFAANVGLSNGPFLIVAKGGTTTDPATGVSISLGLRELDYLVPAFATGQQLGNVLITPISHLVAAEALHWIAAEHKDPVAATDEAWQHMNAAFGSVDWRITVPTDYSAADGGVGTSGSDSAGLVLAGLSFEAETIAKSANVTPGVGFSLIDLVQALADDVSSDGFFDGVGSHGPITLPIGAQLSDAGTGTTATALDGGTIRSSLALALVRYLAGAQNHSGLTVSDVQAQVLGIAADSDLRIFRDTGAGLDSSAPIVTFATQPPRYTNQSSITVTVNAVDIGTSGVAHVFLSQAGVPTEMSKQPDGSYAVTVSLNQGPNPFVVTAVDASGNSTESVGTNLSASAIYDFTAPSPQLSPGYASYKDESSMTVAVNADGTPVMPATYAFPSGLNSSSINGSSVTKASTRLSWGPITPTGAQVIAQDFVTTNVPYLVYTVQYAKGFDAPITSVHFVVQCASNCGASWQDASGEMLLDTSYGSSSTLRFVLPFTTETIPGLSTLTAGGSQLVISASAADAAGNWSSGPSSTSVTFNIIGPPLAMAEDRAWASSSDPRNAGIYKASSSNYSTYWPATGIGDFAFVRYSLWNPAPIPVQITVPIGISAANWTSYEQWNDDVNTFGSLVTSPAPDGTVFSSSYSIGAAACGGALSEPPGPGGCQGQGWNHYPYQAFACTGDAPTTTHANSAASVATGNIGVEVYNARTNTSLGFGPTFTIPAASGTAAGGVFVYVARGYTCLSGCGANPRTRSLGSFTDLNPTAPGSAPSWQIWKGDFWPLTGQEVCSTSTQCDSSTKPPTCTTTSTYNSDFNGERWRQVLVGASTQITGTFGVTTEGEAADGSHFIGPSRTIASGIDFSRTISQ
jgi:hypothetical protein